MRYNFENFDPNKYGKILQEEETGLDVPKIRTTVIDNIKKINTSVNNDVIEPGSVISKGVNKNWSNFPVNPGAISLKKGENIQIGSDNVMITDSYGIRGFVGQEGHHSTGIDFKTKSGKAVALKDGIIIDVKLQGDGKIYSPSSGKKEAGYYVVVKHDDGSFGQYMHLDPMNTEQMNSLKNKNIKRGDDIWGYTKGSGTMSGPHVKVRLYGEDPKVNIDPSQAIKGEPYSFIPNRHGENIIKTINNGY